MNSLIMVAALLIVHSHCQTILFYNFSMAITTSSPTSMVEYPYRSNFYATFRNSVVRIWTGDPPTQLLQSITIPNSTVLSVTFAGTSS